MLHTLKGHKDCITSVVFDPTGHTLATASLDNTIKQWDSASGQLLRNLEAHTGCTQSVSFLPIAEVLASKSSDDTIRLWNSSTGMCLGIITEPASIFWPPSLAFNLHLPLLATVSSDPNTPEEERDRVIHIWELDLTLLLNQSITPTITYTSAKVLLVGDSGVGKTGLGWRLAHGEFKEHSSTHGQQFWLLNQLCKQRHDGAQCEAVLWDLAGQPDYRLIHALFLDDADLALVLFDPTT